MTFISITLPAKYYCRQCHAYHADDPALDLKPTKGKKYYSVRDICRHCGSADILVGRIAMLEHDNQRGVQS